MRSKFVKIHFDLLCNWKDTAPAYRVYVNHELFTERTYTWTDTTYLREHLELSAPPGQYIIRIEKLNNPDANFKIRGLEVEVGSAKVLDSRTFEITNESA